MGKAKTMGALSFCGADLPEPLNTTENLLKNKKLR